MNDSRAWPIRPKWHRYETPKSYAYRQSLAAGVPFRDVERGLTSQSCPLVYRVWFDSAEAARTVEAAAGRPTGHYLRMLRAAQPHAAQLYPTRFLCRLCAAGDVVEQIPHDREGWCTKHPGQMVWAGSGTTPETQVIRPFDRRQARAEQTFRRLATAGLISAQLHARVWEMVRDNASLSQPNGWSDALQEHREDHETHGRAELYPVTVAVLQVLADKTLVARWIGLPSEDLRPAIRTALADVDGPNDVLVERIVLWLRRHRRETRPTRIDPLNFPLDLVDAASIIDIEAPYPLWIQRRPSAVSEWDWGENDRDVDPWDGIGTSMAASWVCDNGHRWTSTPYTRAVTGCPCCAGQLVWRGESDLETLFPEIAEEWDRSEGGQRRQARQRERRVDQAHQVDLPRRAPLGSQHPESHAPRLRLSLLRGQRSHLRGDGPRNAPARPRGRVGLRRQRRSDSTTHRCPIHKASGVEGPLRTQLGDGGPQPCGGRYGVPVLCGQASSRGHRRPRDRPPRPGG